MTQPAFSAVDRYLQHLEASRDIGTTLFEGASRIERLMLERSRKAFEVQMKFLQALAAARDPQGLEVLQKTFFSQSPNELLEVQQEIMVVISEAQACIGRRLDEYRKTSVFANLPNGQAPGAAGTAVNGNGQGLTLAEMLAVWDQNVKQMMSLAEHNMKQFMPPAESLNGHFHEMTVEAQGAEEKTARKRP